MKVNQQPNSYKSKVAFGIKVEPDLKTELMNYSKKWLNSDSKKNLKNILLDPNDTLTLSYNKEAYGVFTERIDVQSTKFPGVKASLAKVIKNSAALSDLLEGYCLTPQKLINSAERVLGQLASKK